MQKNNMERFGGENYEASRLTNVNKVEIDEINKDLLLQKITEYCYLSKEDFSEKDAKTLAAMESYYSAPKEISHWDKRKEKDRCEIKKNFEDTICNKKPEELNDYLINLKNKYCNEYIEVRKKMPKKNKKRKKTMLDRDISEEAEDSFKKSLNGIENEIIIHKILEKIGLATRISSSELDVANKIDLICSDGKLIIAVQVEGKVYKGRNNYNEKIFEKLESADPADQGKSNFFKGMENFERELKAKDQDIKVIKIWINVPADLKKRKFGEYDERLEKEITEGLKQALKIK